MNRAASISAILVSGFVLSACMSTMEGDGERAEIAPRPSGVEGRWSSVGGPVAYTASFQGGAFTSTESGTGASLAQGSYRNLGQGQITISSRSSTSGQESSINCSQMAADRMACVTSGGNRFDLNRQA